MSNKTQSVLFFLFDAKRKDKHKWFRIQDIVIALNSNRITVTKSINTLLEKRFVIKKAIGKTKNVYKLNPIYKEGTDITELIRKLI